MCLENMSNFKIIELLHQFKPPLGWLTPPRPVVQQAASVLFTLHMRFCRSVVNALWQTHKSDFEYSNTWFVHSQYVNTRPILPQENEFNLNETELVQQFLWEFQLCACSGSLFIFVSAEQPLISALGCCVGFQQHTMSALFSTEVPQLGPLSTLSVQLRLLVVIRTTGTATQHDYLF